MNIVIYGNDVSEDVRQANHAIEVALAAARATERRALALIRVAKAKPATLGKAHGIYLRAKLRAVRLERALARIVG